MLSNTLAGTLNSIADLRLDGGEGGIERGEPRWLQPCSPKAGSTSATVRMSSCLSTVFVTSEPMRPPAPTTSTSIMTPPR